MNNRNIKSSRLKLGMTRAANIDLPDSHIGNYFETAEGSLPTLLGGNQWVIISQNLANNSFNSQIAFGFGSGKSIAIRNKIGSDSWGTWKIIT